MNTQPQLVIVGGANGAGKTTFARQFAQTQELPYLGAGVPILTGRKYTLRNFNLL